jgi:hypothetical protein
MWQNKAKDIIAKHARTAYLQANQLPNGKIRKNHVSYSVPEICEALIDALNKDDEHEAKRLFQVDEMGAWTLI